SLHGPDAGTCDTACGRYWPVLTTLKRSCVPVTVVTMMASHARNRPRAQKAAGSPAFPSRCPPMTALPADPGTALVRSQPASDTNCGTAIAPFGSRPRLSTDASIPTDGTSRRNGALPNTAFIGTKSGGGIGRAHV